MIPILYEKDETSFASNGLCRLQDCISCTVTEERNGIYECEFQYPIDGRNFDLIQEGRIIACKHDYSSDVQPFDIVGHTKPLNGIVTFHAVHISYRQSELVAYGTGVNTLADAFTMLGTSQPSNPFSYETDISPGSGYMAAADGVPRSVRQLLGGVEGSILDTYGGEYEWDRFAVKLWQQRGQLRNITIRYGLNLIDYNDDTDCLGVYNSAIPYWAGDDSILIGSKVDSGEAVYSGRDVCAALDLTDKFETRPTSAQLESAAGSLMQNRETYNPSRSITVDIVQLADTDEYAGVAPLERCQLCDSVRVVLPRYGTDGVFKIVKTVYNVLKEKFDSLELGHLSTSLAEALGVGSGDSFGAQERDIFARIGALETEYVVGQGTSGNWYYRKYNTGRFEAWCSYPGTVTTDNRVSSNSEWYRNTSAYSLPALPTAIGASGITHVEITTNTGLAANFTSVTSASTSSIQFYVMHIGSMSDRACTISAYVAGTWA